MCRVSDVWTGGGGRRHLFPSEIGIFAGVLKPELEADRSHLYLGLVHGNNFTILVGYIRKDSHRNDERYVICRLYIHT